MFILGLTGSIGMGKTVTGQQFRFLGIPVYDADNSVHQILEKDKTVFDLIRAQFPEVICDGKINRGLLGNRVFNDGIALTKLEAIVHPRVAQKKENFIRRCKKQKAPIAVLEIPLLFEKDKLSNYNATAVVSAPAFVQKARVLSRSGMTVEKYDAILKKQMPNEEKCRRATFVIYSGIGKLESLRSIRKIINKISNLTKQKNVINRIQKLNERNYFRYRNNRLKFSWR